MKRTRDDIDRSVQGIERFCDTSNSVVCLARDLGKLCIELFEEREKDGEVMRALMKTAQRWIDNCPNPEEAEALELGSGPCPTCEDIKADFIAPLRARLEKNDEKTSR